MSKAKLIIPETSRSIGYYLDLEDSLLRGGASSCAGLPGGAEGGAACGECFMTWQVGPTVIYGRNQDAEVEVNLPWCAEHGVEVYQRHSGGGCVYADGGNLMTSWVGPCTSVEETFRGYMERFASALRSVGVDCFVTGRNDVCVLVEDGKVVPAEGLGSSQDVQAGQLRKISGNAFYKEGNKAIVHGTLMWDVDLDALEKAITPTAEKLASKGIKSVRSRVVNLRELYPSLTLEEIRRALEEEFC